MRSVRLAQIAAQAESVRWRRRAKRIATQIVCLILALPFLLAALGFVEAAFWNYLLDHFWPVQAALIATGGNLLVVAVLMVIAISRGGDDRVAVEALEVRRRALESAQRSVTIAAMAGPVASFLINRMRARRGRD